MDNTDIATSIAERPAINLHQDIDESSRWLSIIILTWLARSRTERTWTRHPVNVDSKGIPDAGSCDVGRL